MYICIYILLSFGCCGKVISPFAGHSIPNSELFIDEKESLFNQ